MLPFDYIFKKDTTPPVVAERVTGMTKLEFDSLDEYSTTMPTSPSVGRRWKRAKKAVWWLGEVFALPESDPKHKTEAEIRWSRIEIK
jgi:hypothetical protein